MAYMTLDGFGMQESPTPFTRENLAKFETAFFNPENPTFHWLRYGQALTNVFNFDDIYGEKLYNEDNGYARNMAWFKFQEFENDATNESNIRED